jgi:hypothetical protein
MVEERDQIGVAIRLDEKSFIHKPKPTFGFEIKILATMGDKDDPMVVPSVYS